MPFVALRVMVLAAIGTFLPNDQDAPVDANFVDAQGHVVKLSDWRGKKSVVLLFMRGFNGEFACYYCGIQTRAYKQQYEAIAKSGAEVLVVLPGAKDAKGYVKKVSSEDPDHPDPSFTLPFPVLLDPDFSACRAFGVAYDATAIPLPVAEPATIVCDPQGRLKYAYHGTEPGDRPKADVVLDVLAGRPPRPVAPAKPDKTATPAATLPWVSWDAGLAQASTNGKPLLLDFHALW